MTAASAQPELAFFETAGRRIAFRRREGASPTSCSCPAMRRTWKGRKQWPSTAGVRNAASPCSGSIIRGRARARGRFEDGTLALWIEEALAAIDQLTNGPLVVAGSSMGGWIALHLALRRAGQVAALVGIAAAPDFTDWGFGDADQAQRQGIAEGFWTSGQKLRLLHDEIPIDCPVRLGPRRSRRGRAARHRLPADAPASFSRCPAQCRQGRRPSPVGTERYRRDPARGRGRNGETMTFLIAVALAAAAPATAACPDLVTPDALVCRALEEKAAGNAERSAQSFEQAALASSEKEPAAARMWAAAATCGWPPTRPARPLWRSTRRWRCPVSKPSNAAKPCSTAPGWPNCKATSRPPAPGSTRPPSRSPTILSIGISPPRWRSVRATRRPRNRRSARR